MMKMRFRQRRRSGGRSKGGIGDLLLAAALLGLVALIAARFAEPEQQLQGFAGIVDGDTVLLAGERVRLAGIDAPELAQTCRRDGGEYGCGREAQKALAQHIGGGRLACIGGTRDRYGRLVATCLVAGQDLGRTQVEAGWAIAAGSYAAEQRAARSAGRGLWAGEFEPPAAWRSRHAGAASGETWLQQAARALAEYLGWSGHRAGDT